MENLIYIYVYVYVCLYIYLCIYMYIYHIFVYLFFAHTFTQSRPYTLHAFAFLDLLYTCTFILTFKLT